jgi:N-carbamoylputrescine amidase
MNSNKTIKVAAIQMTSRDGCTQDNLAHAQTLLERAVAEGAELIVFPELMSQGYRLTPALWELAEDRNGQTTTWLKHVAKNHGVYVGTSFLERAGNRYYNTFALADPQGAIAGWVRKRNPSIWEAYFFEGYRAQHYIDTDIGRIGVGICFDNHTYEVASQIANSDVDLMLMPHSYCIPTETSKMVTRADLDRLATLPANAAKLYQSLFGVPIVLINKSGAWDSPLPTNLLPKMKGYAFTGRSCIIAADGRFLSQLGDEEGIALSEVLLDTAAKRRSVVPKHSRYIYPGPAGREITRVMEFFGKLSYLMHKKRA